MRPGGTGDDASGPGPPAGAGPPGAACPAFDAIVLAGGRARRMSGPAGAAAAGGEAPIAASVDKPAVLVGGQSLLAAVVTAAAGAGAGRVVVVGPPRPQLLAGTPGPPGGLLTVREEPAGSGPVPALRRGLAEATAPAVAVLAADLPFLRAEHLGPLLAAAAASGGAVLADRHGRPQWLAGCWQTALLRAVARAYRGASLHGLLGPLEPALLRYDLPAGEPPPWLDCDTPEDVQRARAWHARGLWGEPRPERTATGKEGVSDHAGSVD